MRIVYTIVILLMAAGLPGCYYDTEEELYSGSTCDTTNVTYAGFIKPLVDSRCTSCHSGGAPSGGIALTSYDEIKTQVDAGRFYGVIAQLDGFQPMPQGEKLGDCDISKVKIWVDNGAQQN